MPKKRRPQTAMARFLAPIRALEKRAGEIALNTDQFARAERVRAEWRAGGRTHLEGDIDRIETETSASHGIGPDMARYARMARPA